MKKLVLGVLIGLSLGQAAKALDVQLTSISVRDYFAGCALAGIMTHDREDNPNNIAQEAWGISDAMMRRRRP